MKNKLIYILTIVVLLILLSFSVQKCNSYKHEYNSYITVSNDTIRTYKDRCGRLVAEKQLFIADIKDLKYLNDSLYNRIKNMKVKNVTSAATFSGVIENTTYDTTYIFIPDTSRTLSMTFCDSNQYKILSGQINVTRNEINMKVDRNMMFFDYDVVLNNGKISISSTNPYVKYNSISGFTLPKQRNKRFGIGPYVGYGVDITNGKPSPQIGIGLQYNIIKF